MPADTLKAKRKQLKLLESGTIDKCTDCKLHRNADEVGVWGHGSLKADIMIVGKMPDRGFMRDFLTAELDRVGLPAERLYFASAVKCVDFEASVSRGDIKACGSHFANEIELVQPKWVLALGNEALHVTTGKSGVTKYRGQLIKHGGVTIMPTLSPSAVRRNPGQLLGWQADLKYFATQALGLAIEEKLPKIKVIDSVPKLKKLMKLLDQASVISYDIETNMLDEFHRDARIVSLSATMLVGDKTIVWALPLWHPESPFVCTWRSVLRHLAPHFERIPKQVAHNAKFDARWLRSCGIHALATFDTMVAAHLLDENRGSGLKPLAQSLLGVAPWGIDTRELVNTPIDRVLVYNALDTYYTFRLYKLFKKQLKKQPRLLRIFAYILMPALEEFIEAERRGIWVDIEKLELAKRVSFAHRDEIDEKLMHFVPVQHQPEDHCVLCESGEHFGTTKWPMTAKNKPAEVNFNASNWLRWFLFEHLEFPILKRGKQKDDGRPGDPSVAEDVLLELQKIDETGIITLLLDRVQWQKYCSTYVSKYPELMDENDRIHTTFKLNGTVTGRISSGKPEADNILGVKASTRRGMNLQQVPRDPLVRDVFGAPPGWLFVEADYSQVELRYIALASQDPVMLRMYQLGQDIHTHTAAWVMGVPESQVTKEDRKKAKAVNFGYVYGMGANKFVHTAFTKYGVTFTLAEAQAIRKQFFQQFPGLLPWHNRQRRLVNSNERVQSLIGRVRHLPDIRSENQGVRAEAERQAINSPIQSVASDLNLWAMSLICKRFREEGIEGHTLGTVHDAINFEIREDHVARALPIIKDTMENLPLEEFFGITLDIPMVADLKVGHNWGSAYELPEDLVRKWDPAWLKEKTK